MLHPLLPSGHFSLTARDERARSNREPFLGILNRTALTSTAASTMKAAAPATKTTTTAKSSTWFKTVAVGLVEVTKAMRPTIESATDLSLWSESKSYIALLHSRQAISNAIENGNKGRRARLELVHNLVHNTVINHRT
jgi:hypothetical protein